MASKSYKERIIQPYNYKRKAEVRSRSVSAGEGRGQKVNKNPTFVGLNPTKIIKMYFS